jgi:hypothetical protein
MMRENRPKLLLYIIIVLGFVGGYIYHFQGGDVVPTVPEIKTEKSDLEQFKNLQINFSLLENEKIKLLKLFGESPVLPGVTGKNNLFAPAE